MEDWSSVLLRVLRERANEMTEDELRSALMYVSGAKPTLCVAAMDYAQRLAEDVDETLRQ